VADDLSEDDELGPAWMYIDRVHFPEQLKLKVNTLLPNDRRYRLASAAWRIESQNHHALVLKALASIIPMHTRMLMQGPHGSYEWTKEMLVNLAIFQHYLETLHRPFEDLMVILSAVRRDVNVVQIVSHGVLLEVLRPPLPHHA
jgi:hypothetical protein